MPFTLHRFSVRVPLRFAVVATVLAMMGSDRPAFESSVAAVRADAPADWPQILGPNRNGMSPEIGLIEKWPEGGPKVVWRVPGGVGMSAVAISRGRALTMVERDRKQCLIALDAATGAAVWQTPLAPEYRNAMGNGPRGTPTIAGDRVFVFTGEGILTAVDFGTGKPIWSHNVVTELGGKVAEYGMACSPLVVHDKGGDRVIVTAGAPRATLVAFDAATGKQLWTAGDDPAGYSSPALLNVGGREQIVAFTGGSAVGVDPAKGTLLWRYPFETNFECNIITPLEIKGHVFLSSGENHGSVLLALKPRACASTPTRISQVGWDKLAELQGGPSQANNARIDAVRNADILQASDGPPQFWLARPTLPVAENCELARRVSEGTDFDITELWTSFGPKSVLRSEWQTPVLLEGHLYGMDNVGGAGPVTHLTAIDAATGERKWQVPRFGKGNLIAADGKLFLTTMAGDLVVARARPDRYDEIGRMPVLGTTRQAPSLAAGRLYLRDDQEIVCVDVRKP